MEGELSAPGDGPAIVNSTERAIVRLTLMARYHAFSEAVHTMDDVFNPGDWQKLRTALAGLRDEALQAIREL
jgi:hypothetical protein